MLVVVLEEGRNLQEEDDAVVVNVALGIALCESLMGRKKQVKRVELFSFIAQR